MSFAQFGRLHPLLLHLPIGFLLAALVLELFAWRGRLARATLAPFLWLAALSAVLAASAGWVLGHEDGYGGAVLERHEQLGIALSALALLAALLHPLHGAGRRLALYRVALVAACGLLVPAGHLGSVLTHGDDWLAGPRAPAAPVGDGAAQATSEPSDGDVPAVAGEKTYASTFAAFFQARCTSCHGPTKHKGGLRLDSYEALLAGGVDGPVLVPGDAAASLILQRVKKPLEDEEHMPPDGRPQPTAEELAALEAWIVAKAPAGGAASGTADPASSAPAQPRGAALAPAEPARESTASAPPAEAPAAALAALEEAFVHVERPDPARPELRLDVAAVAPTFGDEELRRLVLPLAPWTSELVLARSAVGDARLAELARFPHLARLDLRASAVSDDGVRALAAAPALSELNLAQTRVTDAVLETLIGLQTLRAVDLWSTGCTSEGLARLRAARPELRVNAGDDGPAAALESEGELVFTSDRALPGAGAVPEALRPVNTTCPVSGSPVNPKYALVYTSDKGTRVIGFCCPNCPKEFWADPSRFEAKLP